MTETRVFEGDDIPKIFASIKLRKSLGVLPPGAQSAYLVFKGAVFLVGLAIAITCIITPDFIRGTGLRIPLAVLVGWFYYDQVVARRNYGTSHVLVTSRGVLLTDENVYVYWDDIESYQHAGNVVRFRPKPGAGPAGLFAPKELDVPINDANREVVLDEFRSRVKRWKPK